MIMLAYFDESPHVDIQDLTYNLNNLLHFNNSVIACHQDKLVVIIAATSYNHLK